MEENNNMQIITKEMRKIISGPEQWFTGKVEIEMLFNTPEPATIGTASVTFHPGARTAWHTHPLGQILIVTNGIGWTMCENGLKKEIKQGDVIWCNCGKRHWHGATDKTTMTHIAIQQSLDGKSVDWMEKVSDEEYFTELDK